MNKTNKIVVMTLVIMLCFYTFLNAEEGETNKKLESKLQFGFGAFISTSNLLGLIENVKMATAINNGTDYEYPGITEEQSEALNDISVAMRRAILVANIVGGLEYGLYFRVLWKLLMIDTQIVLLPFEGSYNGKLDFAISPLIGIRAPFFIMPYFILGPSFTFSFYPGEVAKIENWKSKWAATGNFTWRPGLKMRLGLELKFKALSFGGYYEYHIKDFTDFYYWYQDLTEYFSGAESVGKIIGSQSRFGISLTLYPFN